MVIYGVTTYVVGRYVRWHHEYGASGSARPATTRRGGGDGTIVARTSSPGDPRVTGTIPRLQLSGDLAATAINPALMVLRWASLLECLPVGLATTQSMGSTRNAALRPACEWSRPLRTHLCGHARRRTGRVGRPTTQSGRRPQAIVVDGAPKVMVGSRSSRCV